MSRWDISDPDRAHSAEPRNVEGERRPALAPSSPAIGRGGSSEQEVERTHARPAVPNERTIAVRTRHQDRDRSYSLRVSELEAMADIGRFRTLDVQDLAHFVYRGDVARLHRDLANLRSQSLIEEKTLYRAHQPARQLVTLTEQGDRIVRRGSGLPREQRTYHGFVKPRELEHDADLYKVYQKAVERIRVEGGKPIRVRLDFELKEAINRAKEKAGNLSETERRELLHSAAAEQGLSIRSGKIHLPDIQVEYEDRNGRFERENLELLSRNYREAGIRGKAAAGFRIYARARDTQRIRRALQDTGLVREVLSV